MKYTDKQIQDLLNGIYEGRVTTGDLPEDLYFAIADYLKKSLYEGYGGNLKDFEMGGRDLELLKELRDNVYMFSGAKVYQTVREMEEASDKISELLSEKENFNEFKKSALEIYDKYNVDWLESEYNTANAQGQNAINWREIEKNKDIYPNLVYSAVLDEVTSEECEALDGLVLPVDDPMWDSYAPPNHFNCRCILQQEDGDAQVASEEETESIEQEVSELVQDEFKMNSGKDGYVFNSDHPYFEVAPKDRDAAKNNFGLPIPEEDE